MEIGSICHCLGWPGRLCACLIQRRDVQTAVGVFYRSPHTSPSEFVPGSPRTLQRFPPLCAALFDIPLFVLTAFEKKQKTGWVCFCDQTLRRASNLRARRKWEWKSCVWFVFPTNKGVCASWMWIFKEKLLSALGLCQPLPPLHFSAFKLDNTFKDVCLGSSRVEWRWSDQTCNKKIEAENIIRFSLDEVNAAKGDFLITHVDMWNFNLGNDTRVIETNTPSHLQHIRQRIIGFQHSKKPFVSQSDCGVVYFIITTCGILDPTCGFREGQQAALCLMQGSTAASASCKQRKRVPSSVSSFFFPQPRPQGLTFTASLKSKEKPLTIPLTTRTSSCTTTNIWRNQYTHQQKHSAAAVTQCLQFEPVPLGFEQSIFFLQMGEKEKMLLECCIHPRQQLPIRICDAFFMFGDGNFHKATELLNGCGLLDVSSEDWQRRQKVPSLRCDRICCFSGIPFSSDGFSLWVDYNVIGLCSHFWYFTWRPSLFWN